MSSRRRTNKKFRNRFLLSFLAYLIIIPLVYFVLDRSSVLTALREEPWTFIAKAAGISLVIAFVISFWGQRDPELRKY